MGKTPPLPMGMRIVICNIWRDALEFVWVRLPIANGHDKNCLEPFGVMQ